MRDKGEEIRQWFRTAMGHHRAGRFEQAERLYRRICASGVADARVFHHLGVVAHQLDRSDAVDLLRQSIRIDPKSPQVHNDLGVILGGNGKAVEAAACFERAVALAPGYAEAHDNLGVALSQQGQHVEAIACFERALVLKPNFALAEQHFFRAHNNLGNILMEQGRFDQALNHYDRAIAQKPDLAGAHYNRGLVFRKKSQFDQAVACFERVLAIEPESAVARLALCMAHLPILYTSEDEIAQRRAAYKRHLEELCRHSQRVPPNDLIDAIGEHQPFYLSYQGLNDRDLQAMYGAMVCRITAAQFPSAPLAPAPQTKERVKVGIVSGFFRHHSNWKIPISGWLGQLDRNRFRLFGYHTGEQKDACTDLAASRCERFVQGPLNVGAWREAILRDAPHVLIYPEVGMDPMVPRLAAQRLAPVQCVSWGHPETSGFSTLDYFLSGELMEPADGEAHYTERLIRLPGLSAYYDPIAADPVPVTRAQLGLSSDAVVFWCGQSLYKYLPQYDAVFSRIAQRAAKCQFAFVRYPGAEHVTEILRKRLDQSFGAAGLRASDYCVFLPRLDEPHYLAAMGACDIFLDSIGWSGCNSTLESLVHNLPIVTLRGDLMRGRHSAAILTMMGMDQAVAKSIDDYVAIAASLATDGSRRMAMKTRIGQSKHRVYRDRSCIAALEEFLEHVPTR
jgi:protein O-GlcNAc transferase